MEFPEARDRNRPSSRRHNLHSGQDSLASDQAADYSGVSSSHLLEYTLKREARHRFMPHNILTHTEFLHIAIYARRLGMLLGMVDKDPHVVRVVIVVMLTIEKIFLSKPAAEPVLPSQPRRFSCKTSSKHGSSANFLQASYERLSPPSTEINTR